MEQLELTKKGDINIPKEGILYKVSKEDMLSSRSINSWGLDILVSLEEHLQALKEGYFLIIHGGEYHSIIAPSEEAAEYYIKG